MYTNLSTEIIKIPKTGRSHNTIPFLLLFPCQAQQKVYFCKKLISKLNRPLVSTSANLSGEKSPMRFSDISKEIIDAVDYVVEDPQDLASQYSASSVIKIWNDGRVKVIRE